MKKLNVALLTIAAITTSAANATLYVGVKAGMSSYHQNVGSAAKAASIPFVNEGLTYGVTLGKKKTRNLSYELSIEELGKVSYNNKRIGHKSLLVGAQAKYLVSFDEFDFYGAAGLAYLNTGYKYAFVKDKDSAPVAKTTQANNFTYTLAVGTNYNFTDSVALNLEYKYIKAVGNAAEAKKAGLPVSDIAGKEYTPSVNQLTVGLIYSFNKALPVVQATKVDKTPTTEKFSLDSEVLFAYNSSKLQESSRSEINKIVAVANAYENTAVAVVGHTDRLGKSSYNLELSKKRALSVANALVNKGLDPSSLTVNGVGSAQPVTNGCHDVKGKDALIKCLAKDRRVDLQITGIKK